MLSLLLLGCGECSKPLPTNAVEPVVNPPGMNVTIIDIRKSTDCEEQTLMEREDKLRISRCGYFGKVGDQFYFYEK